MAIVTALTTAFKQALLAGTINANSDVFKMALYSSSANLGTASAAYTTTGEVTGTNYTAGGINLGGNTIWTDGTTVGLTFTNPTFSNVTISGIQGFMIYDSSKSNVSVMVYNFGVQFNPVTQPFILQMPFASAATGLIQFP